MSQEDQMYSAEKLYEESFQIKFNWKEILPQHVFRFHDLFARETNSPICHGLSLLEVHSGGNDQRPRCCPTSLGILGVW